MKEEWKDVNGYDGLYIVSNYGNIKKMAYKTRQGIFVNEKLISQRKDKDGYCIVTFYNKYGERKDYKVHRIVAQAFIPNPDCLPFINHKNEIRDCNYVGNLEWCNAKYNANYGTSPMKRSVWQKGRPNPYAQGKNNYFYGKHFCRGKHPQAKKVQQYDLNGDFVKSFDCVEDAAESVGVTGGAISMCCHGKRKTAKGYIWKFI